MASFNNLNITSQRALKCASPVCDILGRNKRVNKILTNGLLYLFFLLTFVNPDQLV